MVTLFPQLGEGKLEERQLARFLADIMQKARHEPWLADDIGDDEPDLTWEIVP